MESKRTDPPEAATDEPAFPLTPLTPEAAPDEESSGERRDAFTPGKKAKFLDVLGKTGCILDACRKTGISKSTVYNHQRSDPDFRRHCDLATHMAGTTAELMAWERAVVGVEEDVIQYGKHVGTRIKRSDALLRFLLQGAKPKKYGPRAGFTRKRLMKEERKQIEREFHARIAVNRVSPDEMAKKLIGKMRALVRQNDAERLEQGFVKAEGGHLIPPGWVRAEQRSDAREMDAGDIGWPENVAVSVSRSSNLSMSETPPARPEPLDVRLPYDIEED